MEPAPQASEPRPAAPARPPPEPARRGHAAPPAAAPATAARSPARRATPRQRAAGDRAGAQERVSPKAGAEEAPEPRLSRAEAARLHAVAARAGRKARAKGTHESPARAEGDVHRAAREPKEEASGRALEPHTEGYEKDPPADPAIEALIVKLRIAMWTKRPADEDELGKADPKAYSKEAGKALSGDIDGQVSTVKGSYDAFQDKPAGTPTKPVTELPPPAPAPGSPAIGARRATADPVTPADVSVADQRAALDADAGKAKLDHPNAALVEDGPVAEARRARSDFGSFEKREPPVVLKTDAELRTSAAEAFAKAETEALGRMARARKLRLARVDRDKGTAVSEEERLRAAFGKKLDGIFETAETKVRPILAGMVPGALAMWSEGLGPLSDAFERRLKKVDGWIRKRKESRLSRIRDFFAGLPGWIVREFESAEHDFVEGAIGLARKVSRWVRGKVDECQKAIGHARQEIQKEIGLLPDHLKEFGERERARMARRFDALEADVDHARADLNRRLARKLFSSVEEKRAKVAKLREMSKGLFQKFKDIVSEFIDDPLRAIVNGLLRLAGIPPAAFWAMVERFKTVIHEIADKPRVFANNLVRALKRGFEMFKENIVKHLIRGLLRWLTSKLPEVEVPSEFSVKGIVTMLLQILGISWAGIRKKLVRFIGEKNMRRIEMAVKFITMLVTKGVHGIWEFLKERFDPKALMDAAIDTIKSYLIEEVVKQATLQVVAMLNPVGAVVKAVQLIYKVVKWILDNAAKIFTLIDSVVRGAANIMKGAIAGAAALIEDALGRLVPIVIDLFARLVGLGDLPEQVKKLVGKLRTRVDEAIDKAVAWVAKKVGLKDPGEKEAKGDSAIGEVVSFSGPKEAHKLYFDIKGPNAVPMLASRPIPVFERLAAFEKRLDEIQDVARRSKAKAAIQAARKITRKADKDADALVRKFATEEKAARGDEARKQELLTEEHRLARLLKEIYEHFGEHVGAKGLEERVDYKAGELSFKATKRDSRVMISGSRGIASLFQGPKLLIAGTLQFMERAKRQRSPFRYGEIQKLGKEVETAATAAQRTGGEVLHKKGATSQDAMKALRKTRTPVNKLVAYSYLGFGDILQRAVSKVLAWARGRAPRARERRVQEAFRQDVFVAGERAVEETRSTVKGVTHRPEGARGPAVMTSKKTLKVAGLGTYEEIRATLEKLSRAQARDLKGWLLGEEKIVLKGPVKVVVIHEGVVKLQEHDFEIFARRLRVLLRVEASREGTAWEIVREHLEGVSPGKLASVFQEDLFPHAKKGFKASYRRRGAAILDAAAKRIVKKHAEELSKEIGSRGIRREDKAEELVEAVASELRKKYDKER